MFIVLSLLLDILTHSHQLLNATRGKYYRFSSSFHSCLTLDAFRFTVSNAERDLENFCFWQPYPRVDTFEHALKTCQYGGGTVLNVLSEREYVYFRTRG